MDIETAYECALFNKQFKDRREDFEKRLNCGDLPLDIILHEYFHRTGKHFIPLDKLNPVTCKQIAIGRVVLYLKDIKTTVFRKA